MENENLSVAVTQFVRFLDKNPREIKSFINSLQLILTNARQTGHGDLSPSLFTVLLLIKSRRPSLLAQPSAIYDLWVASGNDDSVKRVEVIQYLQSVSGKSDLTELVALIEQIAAPELQDFNNALTIINGDVIP